MAKPKRYFGTDGIRGKVGQFPITPDFMLKLGWAVGKVLGKEEGSRIVIGKDTRISGYMFESALEAGLSAAGTDCLLLGPMPTPAIARLTQTLHAQAGIVISASHNPFYDNGIKFFSADGKKLADEIEFAIEAQLQEPLTTVEPGKLGKASRLDDAARRYIEFCKRALDADIDLKGLKIILDCANGAAYHIAPTVFKELGAEIIEMFVDPDGLNINAGCGATDLAALQRLVIAERADLGIAFDGDGDRVMMIDHQGNIVDGDQLLFILAKYGQQNATENNGVVGTLMTNLGMEIALKKLKIPFYRAKVGDRYVMEMMMQYHCYLGGESSGHIICSDKTTTGDGIVAALRVLNVIRKTEKNLYTLKSEMQKFPQIMINIRDVDKIILQSSDVNNAISIAEKKLGQQGRVLLRASGTEPVIRVMVEGVDIDLVKIVADELVNAIKAAT